MPSIPSHIRSLFPPPISLFLSHATRAAKENNFWRHVKLGRERKRVFRYVKFLACANRGNREENVENCFYSRFTQHFTKTDIFMILRFIMYTFYVILESF